MLCKQFIALYPGTMSTCPLVTLLLNALEVWHGPKSEVQCSLRPANLVGCQVHRSHKEGNHTQPTIELVAAVEYSVANIPTTTYYLSSSGLWFPCSLPVSLFSPP